MTLRVGIAIGGADSGRHRDWERRVAFVQEAEELGVDSVWSAEAWGEDAATPLAYLAAVTERIRLGSGIFQISARVPVMTAMTAMTLAAMSGDRFICGLGVSGPQVVEGLHGVPFDAPLGRLQETVAVLRLAFAGEKIAYEGRHVVLPRPGGQGKALRLAQAPNPGIPIHLATLGPKALAFTGAAADGWVGTSFVPEAAEAMLGPIREGAEKAGRTLADVELAAGGALEFGDDVEALLEPRRPGVAFTLGAMGSPTTNFYNEAYRRAGFEEPAREVQRLWVEGRRDEAVAAVPDDLVRFTNFLGDDDQVSARIRAYRDAGITTLRVDPQGQDRAARLDTLARFMDLVARIDAEPVGTTP